jgi:predicted phage terminase large subunit-like protein
MGYTSEAMDIDGALVGIDQDMAKRGYIHFVEAAWHLMAPESPFVRSWHVDAICEHLEAVARGELTRLLINVPPNSSKSITCCVGFIPYIWTFRPKYKAIYGSYSDRLARRDSLKARKLIASEWYQARWGEAFQIDTDVEDSGGKYSTDRGGFRMVTTIGGSVTGEHAHCQIVDDPLKPYDVTAGSLTSSKTALDNVSFWWKETMSSRLVDYAKSARIIIMQRLHEKDLAGLMLSEGGYEHLCLPMEYDPSRRCITGIGWEDPREEAGELLCPKRFDQTAVDTLFKDLGGRGSRGAEAQLQQDPVVLTGEMFKRDRVRKYKQLPKRFDATCQSWDCTFKENGSSWVSGQAWGRKGPDYYLIDRIRLKLSFSGTCKQIKIMTLRHPKIIKKIVEAKANGDAIVDHLKTELSGLTLWEPKGSKIARANAIEPYWDAGNIWIPHEDICEWSKDLLNWCVKFPNGASDDDVDSMSQAVTYLAKSALSRLRRAMGRQA